VKFLKWLTILVLIVPAFWLLVFGPRPDESLPRDRVIVDYWEKWVGNEQTDLRPLCFDHQRESKDVSGHGSRGSAGYRRDVG
jgi:hypothetical protein